MQPNTRQAMALQTSYAPIVWECDGSNRSFSITWPFFDASDLVVTCITASGETMTPDYKVKGGKDGLGLPAVGFLETSGIYPAGTSIRIERQTKLTQIEAFADGPFASKRVERALDRAMMALEEISQGREVRGEIFVPANGAAPVVTSKPAPVRSDVDVESIARGLVKAQAEEAKAAHRDLALHIAALKRQLDGLHAAPVPSPAQPDQPVIRTVNEAIVYTLDKINSEAAKRRAQIATPGKELVYAQKQNEARAALDDPDPSAAQRHPETGALIAKYPHLEGMRGVWVQATENQAEDIRHAAMFILGRVADFKTASAKIELALDHAKQRLASASTIEDVLSVPASIIWETP